jgi:hypothetical protein
MTVDRAFHPDLSARAKGIGDTEGDDDEGAAPAPASIGAWKVCFRAATMAG